MKTTLLVSGFLLLAGTAFAQPAAPAAPATPPRPGLTLTTDAFPDGGIIPPKYTQLSANPVSPKLEWTNVPDNIVSFVLIMHDPDTAPLDLDEEPLLDLAEPEPEPQRPEPDPPRTQPEPEQTELDLDPEPIYDDEETDRP